MMLGKNYTLDMSLFLLNVCNYTKLNMHTQSMHTTPTSEIHEYMVYRSSQLLL
jgi:hypothetical protein